MKKTVPLNDGWLFAAGFSREWLEPGFEFSEFYPVSLPHNAAPPPESYGRGDSLSAVYTYMRVIALDEKYNGSRLVLKFDGVSSYAEIYVNGMFVTSHKGDSPFSVDVTAPIRAGFQNCIIVKTDSRIKKDVPMSVGLGPLPSFGGIYRRVWLDVVDGAEIVDAFVRTGRVSDGVAETEIDVTLGDFYPEAELSAEILDCDGAVVGSLPAKSVLSREVTLKGAVSGIKLWDTDNPVLYDAVVTLKYGDTVLDVSRTVFGFRKAEFRRDGFYLNGNKTKLIGLNRLDCFPVLGRAATEELQRFDARKIKQLGCNVVRTHGLAEKSFIDECDRIGLMVISGISGDGYIGGAAWKDALVESIADTVRRDRNSPSVIAWGVRVNNSPDCDELYFKTSKAARDNDPTRAALGSRSFMGSRLYEDVFAYNDYSEDGRLSRRKKTCRLFVPYFVSEHTGRRFPTKRFDNEARRTEHAYRHLLAVDSMLGKKNVSGCAGMAYADFASTGGSGDGVMYYGVLDGYRTDKTAAWAYRSQSDKEPFLRASSTLAPDEFSGRLTVYTNCDSVKLYRDGGLVGEFFPDRQTFKNLPHPPVEIDDLIGDLPSDNDKLTLKQTAVFKYIVGKVKKRGGIFNLSLVDKFIAFVLRKAIKADTHKFTKLVHKYAYAPAAYKIEGIVDTKTVIERQITPIINENRITLEASAATLHPSSSYETVLVNVTSRDSAGNILDYDFSPVSIEVEGEMRLIGESTISLKGGSVGFFLATTPYDGHARVKVSSRYNTETLDLEVTHARVEEL